MSTKRIEVGDVFESVRTCERLTPVYYAAASGDFNPIHLDDEVARAAGLPGVLLHGMCTLAWAADAAVRFVGDPAAITGVGTRFSKPVFPGDTVTFRGRVVRVEDGRLRAEIAATNDKGDEVLRGAWVEARLESAR